MKEKIYDHTAPWKCSLEGCTICKDKPSYNEHMKKSVLTRKFNRPLHKRWRKL